MEKDCQSTSRANCVPETRMVCFVVTVRMARMASWVVSAHLSMSRSWAGMLRG